VDESKLAEVLGGMSDDELQAATAELGVYVAHRRMVERRPKGASAAPFNFGAFLRNFIKLLEAVAPLVGADTKGPGTG
jgi:hypothetical protein